MQELLRTSVQAPWSIVGAISMALAVALGAFGAHALRGRVDADAIKRWETANRYHVTHALGCFAIDVVDLNNPNGWADDPWLNLVGWLFILGTALFSGSLYLMTVKRHKLLGPLTPIGGLAWIGAWLTLAALAVP